MKNEVILLTHHPLMILLVEICLGSGLDQFLRFFGAARGPHARRAKRRSRDKDDQTRLGTAAGS
jgi:hypothetical protein